MYFLGPQKKKYLQHFLYLCKNITFMSFADVIISAPIESLDRVLKIL